LIILKHIYNILYVSVKVEAGVSAVLCVVVSATLGLLLLLNVLLFGEINDDDDDEILSSTC